MLMQLLQNYTYVDAFVDPLVLFALLLGAVLASVAAAVFLMSDSIPEATPAASSNAPEPFVPSSAQRMYLTPHASAADSSTDAPEAAQDPGASPASPPDMPAYRKRKARRSQEETAGLS